MIEECYDEEVLGWESVRMGEYYEGERYNGWNYMMGECYDGGCLGGEMVWWWNAIMENVWIPDNKVTM